MDYKKVLRGLGIALAGAALTYLAQLLPNIHFGPQWTPVVVAVASALVNWGREWYKAQSALTD